MKKKVASLATVAFLSTSITTNALASTYTVQKGDTLTSIAKQHKTSISELMSINNLTSDFLFYNQTLKISVSAPPATQKNETAPSSLKQTARTYTVVPGDSLIKIANKHEITLAELKIWNNIDTHIIYPGQSLKVSNPFSAPTNVPAKDSLAKPVTIAPPASSNQLEYKVISGDNLSRIASQFGLTIQQLKDGNNLKSDLIFPGQKLIINGQLKPTVEQKPVVTEKPASKDSSLISEAKKLIGTPYLFGGSDLNAFDCSGFIYFAFNKAGSPINRLSSEGYYSRSYYVDSPQPGDLVFFANTYKQGISHMGIYIGDNQFIHASPTDGVEITNLSNTYYQKHFDGFKRFY
ncbi:LysM peptidoglycan-binding domain-containing protein [Bacillus sp. FJAT-29790]|uniref:C40 family peptidase n=1 Tax=Bacillus sp. FJAT-29790 TaxID=1895002 RepID=UPI001C249D79|nr:peptidoglycan endopeptidase [Bacillus sp. FJAT-29790]MBU8881138.1 LysM peptidoglycan-binding domain-containing protein [Bacillus sp. FJAT-29790]